MRSAATTDQGAPDISSAKGAASEASGKRWGRQSAGTDGHPRALLRRGGLICGRLAAAGFKAVHVGTGGRAVVLTQKQAGIPRSKTRASRKAPTSGASGSAGKGRRFFGGGPTLLPLRGPRLMGDAGARFPSLL